MPHTRRIDISLMIWTILFPALAGLATAATAGQEPRVPLRDNWALESACQIKAPGEEISKVGFATSEWHKTQVPTTVVGALVADKTYADPYFGMNFRSLPGTNFATRRLVVDQPMPDDSPFRCGWWFRTEFTLPASYQNQTVWLHFDGINYRANLWLNGKKIADAADVAGAFRAFEFNVTAFTQAGKPNALAVEVLASEKNDLTINWVDWNPMPPDKNMGLWKDVYLTPSGEVSLRHPFVSTKLAPDNKAATLDISADLQNVSDHPVKGVLRAEIENIHLEQPVELGAAESKTIRLTAEQHPQLNLAQPRLWWPYQMGKPELYVAKLEFESGGRVSDSATLQFGVREVTSEMTEQGHRLFKINGRKILVRGAAWSSDMLQRVSPERMDAGLRYTRDMGLNAIRLEGQMERDELFDATDRMGILVMPGWCCCSIWERWKEWAPENYKIAGASLADQVRRLRTHPSVFVWLYGSDGPPPADVEKMYLGVLQDNRWPNPSLSSAAADPTTVTGASGVKMTGPYDYEPPNYWLTDSKAGGAYGYNTETSPGPAIPTLESLERFLPADHLWPIDDYWDFHAGGGRFRNVDLFTNGMDRRYGKAQSLDDYLRKAQAMAYEGERAMFEAYGRNKYTSTGVIQWMLNNSWPSLIWHLYDYYLVPGGGYFGTKRACEMVHVQYSYDDDSVAVVNGLDSRLAGMKVTAKIYNLDASEQAVRDTVLDLPPDSSTKAFELPKVAALTTTYFLRLWLHDASGKLVSDNFYWLSTKPDVMDWAKRRGTAYTPQASYGDLTGLNSLPAVQLVSHARLESQGDTGVVHAEIQNPSKNLAFMVRARLTNRKDGTDITPVLWEDNYFSLLPGETREITGSYELPAATGKELGLEIAGWNTAPTSIVPLAVQ
ncbi:MAG: glycosyl hydrolase 2 galactose-binding domain-containing protein [Terriglobia bacterium]